MSDAVKQNHAQQLELEVQQEIERSGLSEVVAAKYLPSRRVIRVGRPGPDGVPIGGIDYPIDGGFATIREHLQLYRRLRDVWEG